MKTRVPALFAASATAAALAAPAVGTSTPGTQTYDVTLTGSQVSVVAHAGEVRNGSGCTFDVDNLDRQTLTFSDKRRVRLVLRRGHPLPTIRFATRVAVAGSRHRESRLTDGDPAVCGPSQPPTTTKCDPRRLPARLTFHPAGRGRVVLGGALTGNGNRLACATTLTTPDPFLFPAESRLALPRGVVGRLFAKGRLHLTTKENGVLKTTDVRWTIVLKRVP
ncbi:MAG TPA: hypothetical protein VF101_04595 [Gaiellaceae bacterium]